MPIVEEHSVVISSHNNQEPISEKTGRVVLSWGWYCSSLFDYFIVIASEHVEFVLAY